MNPNLDEKKFRVRIEHCDADLTGFELAVIEDWNNLPNAVKEATSAERFKRQYRRHQVGTVAPAREG